MTSFDSYTCTHGVSCIGFNQPQLKLLMTSHYVTFQLMWADIFLAHILTFFDVLKVEFDLKKYTKLMALKQKVESHPKIAAWIKSRPDTSF